MPSLGLPLVVSGGGAPNALYLSGVVRTTDATLTTVLSVPIPVNTVGQFQAWCHAIRNTKDSGLQILRQAGILRDGGAALISLGASTLLSSNVSAALVGSTMNPSISGTDLLWTVQGLAGITIDWRIVLTYYLFTP